MIEMACHTCYVGSLISVKLGHRFTHFNKNTYMACIFTNITLEKITACVQLSHNDKAIGLVVAMQVQYVST